MPPSPAQRWIPLGLAASTVAIPTPSSRRVSAARRTYRLARAAIKAIGASSGRGQLQLRRQRALVDERADVAAAAGVEEHVPLADAGLLLQEAGRDQPLAD